MKVLINWGGPVWGDVDEVDVRLRQAAPDATFVKTPDEESLQREGRDAEVCWGTRRLAALLEVAEHLRWVASVSAGVEGAIDAVAGHPQVTLTSGAGTYDIPITEHAFALLLGVQRKLQHSVRRQLEHRWDRPSDVGEIHGRTLGIVGLGSIGREVARVAKQGFRMRVLGHKNREVDAVPHVDVLHYGTAGLHDLLAASDVVVVATALTPDTRHLLDAAALDRLPRGAVIVNIARGAVIDEAAMAERLADGRLAGAGLDVFEQEPLPQDSPLWDLDNVIVAPHYGGASVRSPERQIELFCRQLQRYVGGEPLDNVVDPQRGY